MASHSLAKARSAVLGSALQRRCRIRAAKATHACRGRGWRQEAWAGVRVRASSAA